MSQRDVKNRIASVRNIQKITRAMEMVSAARLRRAEQRIAAPAPVRRGAAADDAPGRRGGRSGGLVAADPGRARVQDNAAILFVTGDRGLAGAFNSQIVRAGHRRRAGARARGPQRRVTTRPGRRGVSSLAFRKREPAGSYVGFTDRPSYANAREIADDLMGAYVDGKVDTRRDLLQRLHLAARAGGAPRGAAPAAAGDDARGRRARRRPRRRRATSRRQAARRSSSTSPTRSRSCAA